jgi:hypothetical protein
MAIRRMVRVEAGGLLADLPETAMQFPHLQALQNIPPVYLQVTCNFILIDAQPQNGFQ